MDFRWYFMGDIRQDSVVFYRNILSEIKKCELEENVCFWGTRINPYPYLKKADLYIHPSRFEGKSIALDEAKIFCKPIVVTCFSTVSDQFEDNWNASVCEMDAESLAAAIEDLAINVEKRQKSISHASLVALLVRIIVLLRVQFLVQCQEISTCAIRSAACFSCPVISPSCVNSDCQLLSS